MTPVGDDGARYLRQRMLAEVGTEGQALLGRAAVHVLGGTASARIHAADYLHRAGLTVHVSLDDEDTDPEPDAHPLALLGPLTSPAVLTPATDLLIGALTAVEGIKHVLGVGQPAVLPPNLFLLGDD